MQMAERNSQKNYQNGYKANGTSNLPTNPNRETKTKFIQLIHKAYRRWAHFVVRYRIQIIALSTVISSIGGAILFIYDFDNDVTGHTPYNARSREELAIREEFFDAQGAGAPFGVFLLVVPKADDGNLLNLKALDEIIKLDDAIQHNITLFNHVTNRLDAFADFCRHFCNLNDPIRMLYNGLTYRMNTLSLNDSLNSRIQLDYPVIDMYGRKINIQPNFHGIEFWNSTESSGSLISNMKRVKMIALIYQAERVGKWSNKEVKDYELGVSRYVEKSFSSEQLRVMSISTSYFEREIVRAGLQMLPFLAIGFLIMATCSSITVAISATYMRQFSIHKISLAIVACICPFMASGTALGFLILCGVRYSSILLVTPFLVLAIGVEDAYLMIHGWQRICQMKESKSEQTTEDDIVANRLALVLIDTGPAILISALTNIAADAVGAFMGSPEITLLCVGNLTAILCDFFFQITYFCSVMAIVGILEVRSEHMNNGPVCQNPKVQVYPFVENAHSQEVSSQSKNMNNHLERIIKVVKTQLNSFVNLFVNLINSIWISSTICLIWLAFICFSIIGICKFEVNLTTRKLYAQDSPLLEIDNLREHQINPSYTLATIFVNNPGNLSNPARLNRTIQMVERFEQLPESWGRNGTNFFIPDYLGFLRELQAEEGELDLEESDLVNGSSNSSVIFVPTFKREQLEKFLNWPEYTYWKTFVRLRKNASENINAIERFFFTTAYHGPELSKWSERTRLLMLWRGIIDEFAELNASVYHDEGIFLDLVVNMPSDTWQQCLVTLISMTVICTIFLFNVRTVLVTSAVIASIIIGTLGTLSWQSVTLDPIMMGALIISVGFSVDIPAHISFHYHSAGFDNSELLAKDRLRCTLASVGFPSLQASLSTTLCVLSLALVPQYMAQSFVQIMCLCILYCVINSLVVLPAVFSLIEKVSNLCRQQKRTS